MYKIIILISFLNTYFITLHAQSGFIKSYNHEMNRMFAMKQTNDGGYAATGIEGYATPDVSWDVYFVKFDEEANIQWQLGYGSTHGDEAGQNFIQMDDGGFMITGYKMTVVFEQYRFQVLKIDSIGNFEWVKYYNYYYGSPGLIVKTEDGGAVISNFIYSDFGSVVMKLDSLGNVEWSKNILHSVESLISLTDGHYVLSCTDGFIVKIDEDGSIVWSRNHNLFDFMNDIVALDDHTFAGLGTNYDEDAPILTKFNEEGYPVWSKKYIFGPDVDFLKLDGLDLSANDGYYLYGYLRFISSPDRIPMLLKTDSTGSLAWSRLPNDIIGAPPSNGFTATTDEGSMMLVDAYNGGVGAYTIKFDTDGNSGCESVILPAMELSETLSVVDSAILLYDYDLTGLPAEFNSEIASLPEYTLICGLTPPCSLPPSGLFANNITTVKAKLNWDTEASAIKYKVQYRASTSPVWISVNATMNIKTLTGLTANTTYKYRVRSLCTDVPASPWSSVEEFTTLPLREGELHTENSIDFNIYPNPNNGIFTLYISEFYAEENIIIPVFISIKNMLGEEIYTENLSLTDSYHQINLDKNIPNGIYVVELSTLENNYSKQIIISK